MEASTEEKNEENEQEQEQDGDDSNGSDERPSAASRRSPAW